MVRKSDGKVIVDTGYVPIEYESQYIQFGTSLSSKDLYGLGETEHTSFKLDTMYTRQTIFARDQGVGPGENLYGSQPFLLGFDSDKPSGRPTVSGNAFGLFLKSSNMMEIELTPKPGVVYRTLGGIIDLYVFLGDSPAEIVQHYTEAFGRPVMVPYWSLGFQLSRYGYTNADEMYQTLSRNVLSNEVPVDVIWGDIDYRLVLQKVTKMTENG